MPRTPPEPVLAFHLLGTVDYDVCQTLQKRRAFEAGERADRRVEVLLCEHPEMITVGRAGSRAHIRLDSDELARRQLEVRWVSRSGGCVLHAPGQLAVYPIVPLELFKWPPRAYVARLKEACIAALSDLSIAAQTSSGSSGIWGHSGQLASVGVAVRHGVTTDGLFVNVNPISTSLKYIDSVPPDSLPPGVRPALSSLLAERRLAVKMTGVRAALVANLAAALGSERYHLHTGHPQLTSRAMTCR